MVVVGEEGGYRGGRGGGTVCSQQPLVVVSQQQCCCSWSCSCACCVTGQHAQGLRVVSGICTRVGWLRMWAIRLAAKDPRGCNELALHSVTVSWPAPLTGFMGGYDFCWS